MRKLKFIISVMAALAAQWAVAVTLPSSSYSPYSGSDASYDGAVYSVTLPKSSFNALGTSEWCSSETPGTDACENCCTDNVVACYGSGEEEAECDRLNLECTRYCDGGSLPLDAPLWFMLVGAVILSAAKNLVRRYSTVSES